jgi:hypothetical protein
LSVRLADTVPATLSGYDPFGAEMVVCTTCGAVVGFSYMVTHTRWHEGRWAEPIEPINPPVRHDEETDQGG